MKRTKKLKTVGKVIDYLLEDEGNIAVDNIGCSVFIENERFCVGEYETSNVCHFRDKLTFPVQRYEPKDPELEDEQPTPIEDIPDKALVECWDTQDNERSLYLFDAKHKSSVSTIKARKHYLNWNHYRLIPADQEPNWAKNARKRLNDLND